MKKNLLRPACAVLAAVLLASSFTGCRKKEGGVSQAESTPPPEFVYVPEYITVPPEVTDMTSLCVVGDKLYFSSMTMTDTEKYIYGTKLYSMNMDGTGLEVLANYVPIAAPEGAEGNSYISTIRADSEGNLWIYENGSFYTYELPEDFDPETDDQWQYYTDLGQAMQLRKLDSTGAELANIDLSQLDPAAEYFYINQFNIDDLGNLYVTSETSAYILGEDGAVKGKVDSPNYFNEMIRLSDGRIATSIYSENGYELKPIDPATKSFGEAISLPDNMYNVYPGGGDFLFVYGDGSNLYGMKEGAAEGEKLLNWIDSDVDNNNMNGTFILPDGRILCLINTYKSDSQQIDLVILSKQPYDPSKQKTILTMATMYLDYNIRSAIIDFNRTNENFRIQVNEYDQYNTEEDWTAGVTKLSTEIISGNVPDILCVSQLPFKQYVAKGLLVDLYPYIDNDPELSRDQLMESVFKATEMDGGLYQVFSTFNISTIIGSPDVLGEGMGWTMDEMKAVIAENPQADFPLGMGMTREAVLQQMLYLGMDEYVDWATGECHFDDGSFASLLEFSATFPENFEWDEDTYVDDYTMITEGRQLMMMHNVYDFDYATVYKALFGGKLVFKGYPTSSGTGNVLSANSGLAITSKCKDIDAAWQFVRTILTEQWQRDNVWELPTNKIIFDEKLEIAMTPQYTTDEDGNQVEISRGGIGFTEDNVIEFFALKQEEVDMIMELINSVTGTMSTDEALLQIITEGAADFYSGRSTAQEAASIIQSRAKIYLSEQS
ncbi:MAG: extracellular solute-binding protein [Oscillospiraceae bacterium]|jgi:ABC-type glycerol-3-phosphate transport system substrate-binding protein|nr:extracellular solute-binding protein [Oscillospiraceae bacterium]